jgi:enoyl-CoA hydratase
MIETGDKRIVLSVDGQIATIRLERPEKLNALDFDMIIALERAAILVDDMKDTRAVILTGSGDKSFCAGGDIEAWSALDAEDFAMKWVRYGHRAFDALARMRHPLVAAINGHCLGGGLELAATADFRIAEEQVKLGLPETGIGIIPGWSGTQRAVRRFGSQIIRRMALGGEILESSTALTSGLVDKVVAKNQSYQAAHEMAVKISERSPSATRLAKLMINMAEGEESEAAIETLGGYIAAGSIDLAKGLDAFRKKRQPNF